LQSELRRMLPPTIAVECSPIVASGAHAEALLEMSATAGPAADKLAATSDVMLYACLSTSLARGSAWDGEISADILRRTGRTCVTAASATVRAVHAVGATRIGLVTPYPEDIDRLLPAFFAEHGIQVTAQASLSISDIDEVGRREPAEVYQFARALRGEFDAIVVVATDLREAGVAVITTNQAMAWVAMDTLGAREPVSGYGRLFGHRPRERNLESAAESRI
jgi:maleate isomerase